MRSKEKMTGGRPALSINTGREGRIESGMATNFNLYQKLAQLSDSAGHVEKTGNNSGLGFKFIEHKDHLHEAFACVG